MKWLTRTLQAKHTCFWLSIILNLNPSTRKLKTQKLYNHFTKTYKKHTHTLTLKPIPRSVILYVYFATAGHHARERPTITTTTNDLWRQTSAIPGNWQTSTYLCFHAKCELLLLNSECFVVVVVVVVHISRVQITVHVREVAGRSGGETNRLNSSSVCLCVWWRVITVAASICTRNGNAVSHQCGHNSFLHRATAFSSFRCLFFVCLCCLCQIKLRCFSISLAMDFVRLGSCSPFWLCGKWILQAGLLCSCIARITVCLVSLWMKCFGLLWTAMDKVSVCTARQWPFQWAFVNII